MELYESLIAGQGNPPFDSAFNQTALTISIFAAMLISPVLGRECPPNEIDDALQKRLQSIVIATAGDPAGRSSKLRSEGKLGIVLADYIENFKTFKNLGDSYIRILKEKDNIEDHAVTLFLSTLLFLPVDWVEKKSVGELYERLAEIERKYCIYEESDPFINAIHYRYKTYVTAHKWDSEELKSTLKHLILQSDDLNIPMVYIALLDGFEKEEYEEEIHYWSKKLNYDVCEYFKDRTICTARLLIVLSEIVHKNEKKLDFHIHKFLCGAKIIYNDSLYSFDVCPLTR